MAKFTSTTAPRQGRKKGTKNRTTEQTRELIQNIVNANLDHLEQDLESMSPTNRWLVLEKLTKYFLPALTKNDNINEHKGMEIIVKYQNQDNKPADGNSVEGGQGTISK